MWRYPIITPCGCLDVDELTLKQERLKATCSCQDGVVTPCPWIDGPDIGRIAARRPTLHVNDAVGLVEAKVALRRCGRRIVGLPPHDRSRTDPKKLERRVGAWIGRKWSMADLGDSPGRIVEEEPGRRCARRFVIERLEDAPIHRVKHAGDVVVSPRATQFVLTSDVDHVATTVIGVVATIVHESGVHVIAAVPVGVVHVARRPERRRAVGLRDRHDLVTRAVTSRVEDVRLPRAARDGAQELLPVTGVREWW